VVAEVGAMSEGMYAAENCWQHFNGNNDVNENRRWLTLRDVYDTLGTYLVANASKGDWDYLAVRMRAAIQAHLEATDDDVYRRNDPAVDNFCGGVQTSHPWARNPD
jgi:hypothetical protein